MIYIIDIFVQTLAAGDHQICPNFRRWEYTIRAARSRCGPTNAQNSPFHRVHSPQCGCVEIPRNHIEGCARNDVHFGGLNDVPQNFRSQAPQKTKILGP